MANPFDEPGSNGFGDGEGKEEAKSGGLGADGPSSPAAAEGMGSSDGLGGTHVVYGLDDGDLGMMTLHDGYVQRRFHLPGPESGNKDGISLVSSHDLTKDGVSDLIVARNDGRLQVYGFDMGGSEPNVQFNAHLDESIHAMTCGVVSSPGFEELVAVTYSGRVMSFTTEPVNVRDTSDAMGRSVGQLKNESRVKSMRKELDDLHKKVLK